MLTVSSLDSENSLCDKLREELCSDFCQHWQLILTFLGNHREMNGNVAWLALLRKIQASDCLRGSGAVFFTEDNMMAFRKIRNERKETPGLCFSYYV